MCTTQPSSVSTFDRVIDREFDYWYNNPSSVVNVYTCVHPEEVGHDDVITHTTLHSRARSMEMYGKKLFISVLGFSRCPEQNLVRVSYVVVDR